MNLYFYTATFFLPRVTRRLSGFGHDNDWPSADHDLTTPHAREKKTLGSLRNKDGNGNENVT